MLEEAGAIVPRIQVGSRRRGPSHDCDYRERTDKALPASSEFRRTPSEYDGESDQRDVRVAIGVCLQSDLYDTDDG